MRIAIIGAGNVGGGLGQAFAAVGHDVVFGVRDPDSTKTLAALAEIPDAAAASPADAVDGADLIVFAVRPAAIPSTVATLPPLAGRIVIDAMNRFDDDSGRSTTQDLAALLPGARIAKAFNTIGFENYAAARARAVPVAMFVAGGRRGREARGDGPRGGGGVQGGGRRRARERQGARGDGEGLVRARGRARAGRGVRDLRRLGPRPNRRPGGPWRRAQRPFGGRRAIPKMDPRPSVAARTATERGSNDHEPRRDGWAIARPVPPAAPDDRGAARTEAERCLYCDDAACTRACPTGIDVPVVHPQDRDRQRRGQRADDPGRQPARGDVRRGVPGRAPVRGRLRPDGPGPPDRDRPPAAGRGRTLAASGSAVLHARRGRREERRHRRRRTRRPRLRRRAAAGRRRRDPVRRQPRAGGLGDHGIVPWRLPREPRSRRTRPRWSARARGSCWARPSAGTWTPRRSLAEQRRGRGGRRPGARQAPRRSRARTCPASWTRWT